MFDFFEFLLAPLVFILDIIAIFDIVTSQMDTMKKVIWVAVILFLTLLGLILYYLIEKRNVLKQQKHQ